MPKSQDERIAQRAAQKIVRERERTVSDDDPQIAYTICNCERCEYLRNRAV